MFRNPHRHNRADASSLFSARRGRGITSVFLIWFLLLGIITPAGLTVPTVHAQDTVTGAFEGTVTNSQTGAIIPGAAVQIINQQTNQSIPKTSDARGRFYAGLLA
ncbi:MAG: hypothetical protein QOE47_2406, partial [Pyrinomonadaceae bacterium]|nr:hypothetical protein [Pyrinomonadaceae bacterium]